ncbi:MAG: metallophosphoesterase [Pseudomonadales bacterium]|nr:metallophosphoesterase [Pseudomonadales bacterium]
MSKIVYFSDIHIEIRKQQDRNGWTSIYPLGLGPDLSAFTADTDLVVLAGDVGRMRSRRDVSTLRYAEQVADYVGSPVVVVPGNHEYYRGAFDDVRDSLLAAPSARVTVLDRGEARYSCTAGILRVLGATLWTDYAVLGDPERDMSAAAQVIPDHRLIRQADGSPFLPQDALAQHRLSRAWLAQRLAEQHDGPTLIVTHHLPHSVARSPIHGTTPLSPAFYSDCDDLIAAAARSEVVAWIFGHHHWSHEIEAAGVRLVSAQLGYPGERTAWNGPGILWI